ncbi:MotA/TolQ/ExbB proton channel [Nitrosococcus halophilus Nc 4]|uniref:MotA/TolQ/ExbB proton channel n=1 Tax=Nitrosococcus halophilus (strain Nc4) TaxID=472759 RepID=D5C3E3_NITHN|nr:MotA/TolQ/ExbB proton channel family protein [Nitrosococcus halophilus]ADE16850.1 MotA/TolQ/ExbB proton channel [Nitrosococcus halophilus Nc 4]
MMNIRSFFTCLMMLWVVANSAMAQPEDSSATVGQAEENSPEQPSSPAQKPTELETLEAAYKREFAFLQSQKRELEQRIDSFRQKSQSSERQLEGKIRSLERKNVSLTAESDRLNRSIEQVERRSEAARERNELLQMTFKQADATLESYGLKLQSQARFEQATPEEKLAFLFGQGLRLLRQVGQVQRTQDKFFLGDGTEAEGTVIRFGNIAAYGVSSQDAGILVPAGGERFKMWSQPAPEVAKALAEGQQPSTLKIFLFESQDHAVEEKAEKTLLVIINEGGPVAWVIVGLGGVALLLILLRVLFLSRASANTRRLTQQVNDLIQQGKRQQAQELCQQTRGAIARVMAATIRNLERDRPHLEDIISEAILHESAHLNRFGSMILIIAAISPLLGLLGTVTGMISTFDIITEFGTGDPKLLSSGISIALITTEVGLAVAIPTLFVGTLLSSWAERIKDDMEKAALRVTNISQIDKKVEPASAANVEPEGPLAYSAV